MKRWYYLIPFLLVISTACLYIVSMPEKKKEVPVEEKSDLITVGYSQIGSESDWRIANTVSFKSEFTKENGYYLIFQDAQQKQENQLKAVRNFILQEVDYIILDPIVETGWESVLEEAKSAGIPVILTDRFVEVDDDDLYTCWVGSDFVEEGRQAGRWLENYLKEQNLAQDEIQMITLQGTIGSSAQLGRTNGFAEIMEQHPNWKMLELCPADFTQTKGLEVMKEMLKKYPVLDVVICENDNMAFGAIKAIEEAGFKFGVEDITLLSFDASSTALQMVREGKIAADFECNPLLGPKVSEIIQKLEKGESVEKIQYVEEAYFDLNQDLDEILENRIY